MHSPRLFCTFAATAVLTATGGAFAATTPVQPPSGTEPSHADIFSHAYGGAFSATAGGYTNGGVTATRVDDALDQFWTTDGFDATAAAVFADYDQQFGYIEGYSGGAYTNLFDVTDTAFDASGSTSDASIAGAFRFARFGPEGVLGSSAQADNPDLLDHMVTYVISGLLGDGKTPIMMLFFEDRTGDLADWDYNDLVVEVRGARVVPTPAALGAGLAMLAGLTLRRRRTA